MRLRGKVALITGAATGVRGELQGFGGAAAWLFAREGAKVALSDISEASGERTASEIRESGAEAIFVRLDVTKEEEWTHAIGATVSAFGGLDILVNNAGTSARFNVEETTEEVWDAQMDVHAKGVFLGMKRAIPEMRKAGGGSIINVSSMYGLIGSPTTAAYHAAKGASRLLTKSAAIQYAAENIRVNSVHPGWSETPLTHSYFVDPERCQLLLDRVPLGRLGVADDIAQGLLYLASDESSFVTGSELVIDGGVTAQ